VSLRGDHRALRDHLRELVDTLGALSARAQGLPQPITTAARLTSNPDHVLYLHVATEGSSLVCSGLLKTGRKNLFVRDASGRMHELTGHRCVLDFYVHESRQRRGLGRELMEATLEYENLDPGRLAYDRPSPKFIAFLRKHYALAEYVPQSNNFVVFNDYFRTGPPNPGRRYPVPTSGGAEPAAVPGRRNPRTGNSGDSGGGAGVVGEDRGSGQDRRLEQQQQQQQQRAQPPRGRRSSGAHQSSGPATTASSSSSATASSSSTPTSTTSSSASSAWRAPGPAGNRDAIHSHFSNASPTRFAQSSRERPRHGRRSTSPADNEAGLVSTGPAGVVSASSMREIERLKSSLRASEDALDVLKAQQRNRSSASGAAARNGRGGLAATSPADYTMYRPF
jgi:GNAT superfamily N-acetyltransferase